MPKYFDYKVAGYYLYFTSSCTVEAMHAHASDKRMTEPGSAKFFVRENGETEVTHQGVLSNREIRVIQDFIKQHYQEMYKRWSEYSNSGYYGQ